MTDEDKVGEVEPERNLIGEIYSSMFAFHVWLPILSAAMFVIAMVSMLLMHTKNMAKVADNQRLIIRLEEDHQKMSKRLLKHIEAEEAKWNKTEVK